MEHLDKHDDGDFNFIGEQYCFNPIFTQWLVPGSARIESAERDLRGVECRKEHIDLFSKY